MNNTNDGMKEELTNCSTVAVTQLPIYDAKPSAISSQSSPQGRIFQVRLSVMQRIITRHTKCSLLVCRTHELLANRSTVSVRK